MVHGYIILLRGINVGGKNKIAMATLRSRLEEIGCNDVVTYIQSGNVLLRSTLDAPTLCSTIEALLIKNFKLDSSIIKVLVLTHAQLQAVVANKPSGFGDTPESYHSDVIFLMNIDRSEAMAIFSPREGVDKIWPGRGVVYSQRLSAERTKSRLGKIVGTKPYQSMTIRSWNTVIKLEAMTKQ